METMLRRELRLLGQALATGERYGCFDGSCKIDGCDILTAVEANAEALLQALSLERARATMDPATWDEWGTR